MQGSAIGWYGPRDDEALTEESPAGSDFMAEVCREWEEAAHPAEALGVRVAKVRTGVVLAKGGRRPRRHDSASSAGSVGAAPVGNGGNLLAPASGAQWMSWIHIDDIVGIFLLALDNAEAQGPINGTAPNPVRNAEFSKALAKVLWRSFIPLGPPDAVLELVLGEVAQVITRGQRVVPARAQALGYAFRYPDLAGALRALFAPAPRLPKPERDPGGLRCSSSLESMPLSHPLDPLTIAAAVHAEPAPAADGARDRQPRRQEPDRGRVLPAAGRVGRTRRAVQGAEHGAEQLRHARKGEKSAAPRPRRPRRRASSRMST